MKVLLLSLLVIFSANSFASEAKMEETVDWIKGKIESQMNGEYEFNDFHSNLGDDSDSCTLYISENNYKSGYEKGEANWFVNLFDANYGTKAKFQVEKDYGHWFVGVNQYNEDGSLGVKSNLSTFTFTEDDDFSMTMPTTYREILRLKTYTRKKANRIAKALNHLVSLCEKYADNHGEIF